MSKRISRPRAAQILTESLAQALPGRDMAKWLKWLQNNAITERKQDYRIPTIREGRDVFYDPEEITKYIAWVRQQQRDELRTEINSSPAFKTIYQRMVKAEALVKELQAKLKEHGITE